ncbi:helix-turn-helix domain-containing protein [Paenibacillus flagellatus]|uniref:HTH cro/C1-type domain-containing protein n=1 Tax=Paenibacillus flagellatus TaxID=2211139 RepID=A0A2V5KQR4_9BACL|nr:XRE family transcriptional regulator [Paenibacillus flagellatus]PYI51056.1 hypothetical protein DLM86_27210 [Paenibacillus flagellatus]
MKTGKRVGDHVVHELDQLEVPPEYEVLIRPKIEIAQAIKRQLENRRMSVRKLAERTGMQHPQIVRVTSGDTNYNIDTLLKLLDALDLEVVIQEKKL